MDNEDRFKNQLPVDASGETKFDEATPFYLSLDPKRYIAGMSPSQVTAVHLDTSIIVEKATTQLGTI